MDQNSKKNLNNLSFALQVINDIVLVPIHHLLANVFISISEVSKYYNFCLLSTMLLMKMRI